MEIVELSLSPIFVRNDFMKRSPRPEVEVYICGDQPTTCPSCGWRTNFSQEGDVQHHICPRCDKHFDVVDDDEIPDGEIEGLLSVEAAIEQLEIAEDFLLNSGALHAAGSVTNALRSAKRAVRITQARIRSAYGAERSF